MKVSEVEGKNGLLQKLASQLEGETRSAYAPKPVPGSSIDKNDNIVPVSTRTAGHMQVNFDGYSLFGDCTAYTKPEADKFIKAYTALRDLLPEEEKND